MAIETGAPSEAVTVMEKGFDNKMLESKDKDRHRGCATRQDTGADRAGTLPALEDSGAARRPREMRMCNSGRAYLARGKSDKAIESIQRGLKKGGVKGQDEAQMMLGRAHLKLKQKDQARKAFQQVPDDSKLAQVAQLWGLYVAVRIGGSREPPLSGEQLEERPSRPLSAA